MSQTLSQTYRSRDYYLHVRKSNIRACENIHSQYARTPESTRAGIFCARESRKKNYYFVVKAASCSLAELSREWVSAPLIFSRFIDRVAPSLSAPRTYILYNGAHGRASRARLSSTSQVSTSGGRDNDDGVPWRIAGKKKKKRKNDRTFLVSRLLHVAPVTWIGFLAT